MAPPFPDQYTQHKRKIILDNINLLYVALTRAEDRCTFIQIQILEEVTPMFLLIILVFLLN